MGLDFEALKAKHEQFTRQNNRSDALWKPKEGKQIVRIVPWKDNPSNPFVELYFHYLGGKTHLSPTSYGNRDPIAEFADALASGGTKDDYAQARPFRPKLRTFAPVVVRGEEEKGVRWMSFGKTVYTELLAIIGDPDYGDITDVQTGRDIVVEYIPQEKSDTNFAKTMIRPKPNQTPLVEDSDVLNEMLTDQPNLRNIFREPSFEDLKVFLERYLDPDSASSDAPTQTQTETPDAEVTSVTTEISQGSATTGVQSMMDEFDEVFK